MKFRMLDGSVVDAETKERGRRAVKVHVTKDGEKIKLCKMTDSHLDATIRLFERRAKEGITVRTGGGSCMIYNESCFETFRKISDKSVDFVFTSPPYNRKRNDKYMFYSDVVIDYFNMLDKLVEESIRVCKKYVFINIMKNYYNSSEVYRLFGKYHDKIAEVFVWEKSNPLPASGFSITNAFEYIIVFGKKGLKSNKTYTKNHLTTSVARMSKDHKAVMHQDVADFFIGNFMKKGDVCYDPFLGTGTTAISCNKFGVDWFGSEIAKEYAVMAKKRIEEHLTTASTDTFDLFCSLSHGS